MPDDLDHVWLRKLLDHPERWTGKDHDAIAFFLRQAHEDLVRTPTHHAGTISDLRRSIARYETAMDQYRASRPSPRPRRPRLAKHLRPPTAARGWTLGGRPDHRLGQLVVDAVPHRRVTRYSMLVTMAEG